MEGKEVGVKKKGSSQKLPQFVRHYGIIHSGIIHYGIIHYGIIHSGIIHYGLYIMGLYIMGLYIMGLIQKEKWLYSHLLSLMSLLKQQ